MLKFDLVNRILAKTDSGKSDFRSTNGHQSTCAGSCSAPADRDGGDLFGAARHDRSAGSTRPGSRDAVAAPSAPREWPV